MPRRNDPLLCTLADSRRTAVQPEPCRLETVSRTRPATAPVTLPASRVRAPRTSIPVACGPAAPAMWPSAEIRAFRFCPADELGGCVAGSPGGATAVGAGVTTGVGVGVGV